MESILKGWSWTKDQPAAIVVVILLLTFVLMFPHEACRGESYAEGGAHVADHPSEDH